MGTKNSAASTLLNIVKSYNASDVMEFTAQKKASDHDKARTFNKTDEAEEHRPSSSVIVIDSNMTPLEAATLLWENNV